MFRESLWSFDCSVKFKGLYISQASLPTLNTTLIAKQLSIATNVTYTSVNTDLTNLPIYDRTYSILVQQMVSMSDYGAFENLTQTALSLGKRFLA